MFYVFYQSSLSVSLEEILIYLEASVTKMPWLWTLATFNVFDHDRSLKTLKDNTGFNRFDPTAWKLQCWLGKLWKNPSCWWSVWPWLCLNPVISVLYVFSRLSFAVFPSSCVSPQSAFPSTPLCSLVLLHPLPSPVFLHLHLIPLICLVVFLNPAVQLPRSCGSFSLVIDVGLVCLGKI